MNIENINTTCPICMNNIENPCSIGCRHLFCKTCIVTWLSLDDMLNSHKCPVCRRNYIGLFEIEEKLIKSKYKTRSSTMSWRGIRLYMEAFDKIHRIENLHMESRIAMINELFALLYDNKEVLLHNKFVGMRIISESFLDIIKKKLDEFSLNENFKEAKIWKFKFRNVLK